MSAHKHFKTRLAQWVDSDDFRTWLRDEESLMPDYRASRRAARFQRACERRERRGRSWFAGGFFGAMGVMGGIMVFGLVMGALALFAALLGLALRLAVIVGVIWLVMRFFNRDRVPATHSLVPVDRPRF